MNKLFNNFSETYELKIKPYVNYANNLTDIIEIIKKRS